MAFLNCYFEILGAEKSELCWEFWTGEETKLENKTPPSMVLVAAIAKSLKLKVKAAQELAGIRPDTTNIPPSKASIAAISKL